MRRPSSCILAVVLLAVVAMGAGVRNDFVAWDDPQTIAENPLLHPPSLRNVASMWTQPAAGLYVPLTYSIWSMLAVISANAWIFHLAGILAHCIAAALVYLILVRVFQNNLAACAGAILFAVHPLQVEPVAWASGLKDVLAATLALAAILLHLRSKAISSFFFALAMLAKPSAASAIPIALLLDWHLHDRPMQKSLSVISPWIIVAVPLLIVARFVQVTPLVHNVPLLDRPLIAGDALAFYLMKLIAPVPMATDYGRTPTIVLASARFTFIAPLALAIILAITRNRTLCTAGMILLSGLIWNLGLATFEFQLHSTVADHYMYLAMLAPAMCSAWLVARWRATLPIVGVVLAIFTAMSIRQTLIWRDSVSLFTNAIAVNPKSIASREDLGRVLGERGDLAGAGEQFRAIVALDPRNANAFRSLSIVAQRQHRLDDAIENLAKSVQLNESRDVDVSGDRFELMHLMHVRETSTTREMK